MDLTVCPLKYRPVLEHMATSEELGLTSIDTHMNKRVLFSSIKWHPRPEKRTLLLEVLPFLQSLPIAPWRRGDEA